jgi:Tol biopolymer transport system component
MPDLRSDIQKALGSGYVLADELSGGGMSRVFVAQDSTLGRRIIVKVMPPETAVGVNTERFNREIAVVARLQHPHIVPLLSAGDANGLPFFTMPFVSGESLRARLDRSGPFSVADAIRLLRDVAAALAYAHDQGVVHRDIKPENILLSGGVAVVTDFGVAKALKVAGGEHGTNNTLTSAGIALGTPAYMSPEQASAAPDVDHRADIYSFGCLAYELLAGTSPFAGRTSQQMLAAHVIERPESLIDRRPSLPAALDSLVMQCLEKNAADRPQSATALISALDDIVTPPVGTSPTTLRSFGPRKGAAVLAGLLIIVASVIGWRAYLRNVTSAPLAVVATLPVAVSPTIEIEPAISPDGKLVAFSAELPQGPRIFVRQVDGERANILTDDIPGRRPRWSRDGSRLSFISTDGIYAVPTHGGTPRRMVETGDGGFDGVGTHSWSPDDKEIVYATREGIWIRAVTGGSPRLVVRRNPAIEGIGSPEWSPDGRLIAYVEGYQIGLGNTSPNTLKIVRAAGGTPVSVSDSTHVNVSPTWAPDSRKLLFVSNMGGTRDIWQQRIDADGRPIGSPSRQTSGLSSFNISMASDGSQLAYDVVKNANNVWWVSLEQRWPISISSAQPITRENHHIEMLSVSPDGRSLAYSSDRAGNQDIYTLRIDGGEPVQLTSNTGNDFAPVWSPDGREIAFYSHRNGIRNVYVMNSDGTAEQQITRGPGQKIFPSWSPDGKRIVFGVSLDGLYIIERASNDTWTDPRRLTADSANIPRWSPRGDWIVYAERMRPGWLIQPDGKGRRRLSADGKIPIGPVPAREWSPDGSTVFLSVRDSTNRLALWAVPIAGGSPRKVLSEDSSRRIGREYFATDGRRLFFTLRDWESEVYVMQLKR